MGVESPVEATQGSHYFIVAMGNFAWGWAFGNEDDSAALGARYEVMKREAVANDVEADVF